MHFLASTAVVTTFISQSSLLSRTLDQSQASLENEKHVLPLENFDSLLLLHIAVFLVESTFRPLRSVSQKTERTFHQYLINHETPIPAHQHNDQLQSRSLEPNTAQ